MTEKPIIVTGGLIPAILDDSKTQTRRIIKPQPLFPIPSEDELEAGMVIFDRSNLVKLHSPKKNSGPASRGWLYKKDFPFPYQVGDILWVRETRWRNGGYVATDPPTIQNEGKVPSIFMPRWASRIKLEVTDVRVQRLQNISLEDARAEGISEYGHEFRGMKTFPGDDTYRNRTTVENFAWLWDSLNAKRGYSWEANPWVWAYTFKKLTTERGNPI